MSEPLPNFMHTSEIRRRTFLGTAALAGIALTGCTDIRPQPHTSETSAPNYVEQVNTQAHQTGLKIAGLAALIAQGFLGSEKVHVTHEVNNASTFAQTPEMFAPEHSESTASAFFHTETGVQPASLLLTLQNNGARLDASFTLNNTLAGRVKAGSYTWAELISHVFEQQQKPAIQGGQTDTHPEITLVGVEATDAEDHSATIELGADNTTLANIQGGKSSDAGSGDVTAFANLAPTVMQALDAASTAVGI